MDNTKKGLIGLVTLLTIYGGVVTILPEVFELKTELCKHENYDWC